MLNVWRRLTSSQPAPSTPIETKEEVHSDPPELPDGIPPTFSEETQFKDDTSEPLNHISDRDREASFGESVNPEEQLLLDQLHNDKTKSTARKPKSKGGVRAPKAKKARKGKKVAAIPDAVEENGDGEAENENAAEDPLPLPDEGAETEFVVEKRLPKSTRKNLVNTTYSRKIEKPTAGVVSPFVEDEVSSQAESEQHLIDERNKLKSAREWRNIANAPEVQEEIQEDETEPFQVPTHNAIDSHASNPDLLSSTLDVDSHPIRTAEEFAPTKSSSDLTTALRKVKGTLPARANEVSFTPASNSRPVVEIPWSSASQLLSDRASSSVSNEVSEAYRQPSKKALGKRKAVDGVKRTASNKRVKRVLEKGPPSKDLRTMFPLADTPEREGPSSTNEQLYSAEMDHEEMQGIENEESLFISPTRPKPTGKGSKTRVNPSNFRSSWTAINLPEDPPGEKSDVSDFQPDDNKNADGSETQEVREPSPLSVEPKSSVRRKRRLPVDEPGPSLTESSASVNKTASSALKAAKPKIPKTPGLKAKESSTSVANNGKLTKGDRDAIGDAVNAFKQLKDLTEFETNEIIQQSTRESDTNVKEFWDSIHEEVAWIPHRKLFDYCRRTFHNFESRGKWTADQDAELKEAYDTNPNKWTLIGRQINRFPEDARDRWRNYVICGDNLKKSVWDVSEENQLTIAVEQCIAEIRADRRRSGTGDEEQDIDWNKVSKLMNHTRSRLQCSSKWKKLKKRRESDGEDPIAKTPISKSWRHEKAYTDAQALTATQKLRLLYAIRDSGAAQEGKIPWRAVRDEIDESGDRMTWKACFRGLKERIPDNEEMKFVDVIDQLIDAFEASAPDEPAGFAIQSPKSTVKRRRSQPFSSRRKKSTSRKSNGEGSHTGPATGSNRKKLHERMRQDDLSTQDTEIDGGHHSDNESPSTKKMGRVALAEKGRHGNTASDNDSDGLIRSLQSLKKASQPRKPRTLRAAKKPLTKAKQSKRQLLSEAVVVEDPSDNEEAPELVAVPENDTPMKLDYSQNIQEHHIQESHNQETQDASDSDDAHPTHSNTLHNDEFYTAHPDHSEDDIIQSSHHDTSEDEDVNVPAHDDAPESDGEHSLQYNLSEDEDANLSERRITPKHDSEYSPRHDMSEDEAVADEDVESPRYDTSEDEDDVPAYRGTGSVNMGVHATATTNGWHAIGEGDTNAKKWNGYHSDEERHNLEARPHEIQSIGLNGATVTTNGFLDHSEEEDDLDVNDRVDHHDMETDDAGRDTIDINGYPRRNEDDDSDRGSHHSFHRTENVNLNTFTSQNASYRTGKYYDKVSSDSKADEETYDANILNSSRQRIINGDHSDAGEEGEAYNGYQSDENEDNGEDNEGLNTDTLMPDLHTIASDKTGATLSFGGWSDSESVINATSSDASTIPARRLPSVEL